MHGLIETLDDNGILVDVVLRHLLLAEPDPAVGLALERNRRLADSQQTVVGVVIELVDEPALIAGVFDLDHEAARPVVADLSLAPDAEAVGVVGAVQRIDIALGAIVPEIDHAVHAAIELDLDLLVALADRGRFELGNALLKIGAAIAAQIGGLGGRRGEEPESAVAAAAKRARWCRLSPPNILQSPCYSESGLPPVSRKLYRSGRDWQ